MTRPRTRTAILISGRGSNMMALVEAARRPDYPAEIVGVVSNRPDAAGLVWAAEQSLPTAVVNHRDYPSRETFEADLHAALLGLGADLIAQAGFMRLLTAGFVAKWDGRLLNIHPSLLPSFKGLHAHEQAIAAGVKIAGCTVHFVTAEMDAGPIVAQAAVPVIAGDTPETLAERTLLAEHKLYPAALAAVASGHAALVDGRIVNRMPVNQHAVLLSPDGT
ncbi:MAG: phosphoribosylglycinamide formyltransferase [Hyphomicrobiaceae bacterium]|nr:phosphoribosylglycinamide formyltransferase [Hyphomicrobiaceae bacterium]